MVADRTQAGEVELHLRVDTNPDAMIFKEPVRTPLYAWVCLDCGLTEFYASEPHQLYAAYQASEAAKPRT